VPIVPKANQEPALSMLLPLQGTYLKRSIRENNHQSGTIPQQEGLTEGEMILTSNHFSIFSLALSIE